MKFEQGLDNHCDNMIKYSRVIFYTD